MSRRIFRFLERFEFFPSKLSISRLNGIVSEITFRVTFILSLKDRFTLLFSFHQARYFIIWIKILKMEIALVPSRG